MKRLLKEPLLHFLLLGALIFGAYSLFYGREARSPDEIVVTQGQIANLVSVFARTWQRPPTADELDGIIQEFIREEIASREAIALGLDQDDTVIRRRLRQKLEFIAQDLTDRVEPTEAELRDYLAANPGAFLRDPRFTFRHIYLNADRRAGTAQQDAESILATLQQSESTEDPAQFGDAFLLGNEFRDQSAQDVDATFGQGVAEQLAGLPLSRWAGPIQSGYGLHLVFLDDRVGSEAPPFEEIRPDIEREWSNARNKQATEDFYSALLKRYTVIIEPKPADQSPPTS